ncbi:glycosyl transferase family 2 [Brevundimonas sp. AAP58]|uniref:glycosyltransferase family 2 protein n=1 Tax=Brevundimonas sp. AAP58 TaxID=1523422 RepID=UPI0006B8E3C9|nr:glycosyltransferase family 2 protein [Brevundimonas sp. AAP58]KPF78627.1 glycosyl transferase family 2 [Brevundimonas sp. AAP58]
MTPGSELARRNWSVPVFDVEVFEARRTRHAVVIPVMNEGERIRGQLALMKSIGLDMTADIVIADGGSTDGSTDPECLRALGVRACLTKRGPGGLSAQLRCAYAWVLDEGYDGVVTIDGNGKDGVETVPRFLAALDDGYGYVQASRYIRGGHEENTPWLRTLAIRLIHAPVLSLAAGRWLTDTTQGYRAYSRDYLLDPRVQPFRDVFVRYELLAYLTVRASQLGYRVREVPTSRVYPKGEAIPTKIRGFRPLFDLLVVLWRTITRAYHPRLDPT